MERYFKGKTLDLEEEIPFIIPDFWEEDIDEIDSIDDLEKDNILYSSSPLLRDDKVPTSVWNVKDKGKYNFKGSANSKKLYTKKLFKGKTKYTVKVNNKSNNAITVKAMRSGKTYAMLRIGKGKSTTNFYLVFDAPGDPVNVTGYVK